VRGASENDWKMSKRRSQPRHSYSYVGIAILSRSRRGSVSVTDRVS